MAETQRRPPPKYMLSVGSRSCRVSRFLCGFSPEHRASLGHPESVLSVQLNAREPPQLHPGVRVRV